MPRQESVARRSAGAPTLTRRHETGAPSARGLLFTVLGEFVLPRGAVWTSTVITVLGRLGVEEKASRQALARTAAAGWLERDRRGRRTRWRLTPDARRLLTEGRERIYSFRAVTDDWDGRLVLVTARVADADRSRRHRLQTRLRWAGFGSPAPGLWVGTHADRADEIDRELRAVEVPDARIFVAEYRGGADLAGMVAQAWDLRAVDERYERFRTEFADAVTGDPLARQLELVHTWRRFPFLDPALPRELLPGWWSGADAARLFSARHDGWADAAEGGYRELDGSGG